MSDPVVPVATTEPVVAPVASATPPAAAVPQEPAFIQSRLERERKAILKDLGIKVKKGEDPAAAITEYKTDKEARRQERSELRGKVAEHEATIEKLSAATAAVKVFAEMEFNALTDAQKAIVVASAGDDPNERLKTIAIMKSVVPPSVAPAVAIAPAVIPIAAPANTAPNMAAPTPGISQAVDVKAEYARLRSDPKNGLLAAAYLLQNRAGFYKPDSQ